MLDMAIEAGAQSDDAIRSLLLARLPDAHKLANWILHDPVAAEDAVQEAALLAWDRRRSLRDPASADAWFNRILVNVCRAELRRRSRRPAVTAGSGRSSHRLLETALDPSFGLERSAQVLQRPRLSSRPSAATVDRDPARPARSVRYSRT